MFKIEVQEQTKYRFASSLLPNAVNPRALVN